MPYSCRQKTGQIWNEQVKRLKRTKIDHLTANAATVEEIQRLVDAKRKLDSLYITI